MKTILVIDDDPSLRSDLLDLLTFESYDVIGAEDGQQGITSAREQQPDLIICDISMPVLDGFGVVSALREDLCTAGIPIILLSAYHDQTTVQKGLRLGATAFLAKPYSLDAILEMVRQHVGT